MNRVLSYIAIVALCISLVACGGGSSKTLGQTPNDATCMITAAPAAITSGQSSTLTWNCQNTKRVTLNNVIVMPVDTEAVSPTVTTVYQLNATAAPGANGASTSITVTVNGAPPPPAPTVQFTAVPSTITAGQTSTLAWQVTNATTIFLDGAAVAAKDSEVLTPPATQGHTILAQGPGGSTQAAVTITVNPVSGLAALGRWTTLGTQMPINPIHSILLNTGKILIVSGSGNLNTQTTFYAGVLDPSNWNFSQQTIAWDMFCNGMVALPDGKILINGGTLAYGTAAPVGQPDVPFKGLPNTSIFDPTTSTFDYSLPPTLHGRWYPTLTEMADGRVMTVSGLEEDGATNNYTVEIFDHKTNTWGADFPANAATGNDPFEPELYPREHLLPSGQVYYSGPTTCSYALDPTSMIWNEIACTIYGRSAGQGAADRTYGSSVLLPLVPEKSYDATVFIMGGDNPAQATTEFIDLNNASIRTACPQYAPCFEQGAQMSEARVESQGVLLPTGKILTFSGSAMDEKASSASLNVDMYDPASNSMTAMAPNAVVRLYHNVALLLPDASVWLAGSNPAAGTYEPRMERFEPPYLFNPDGSYATRPKVTVAPPASVTYSQSFTLQTDTSNIAYVEIMKNGSSTHSFDMEQRFVGLTFTQSGNTLTIAAPPSTDSGVGSGIAPPGYYMLFLMSSAGVPSVATEIQVLGNGAQSMAQSMAGRFKMLATPANLEMRKRVPRSVTESPLKLRSMGGMHH